MAPTTLATQMHTVFSAYINACDPSVGTVWDVWCKVFPAADIPQLLAMLARIRSELDRLGEQFEANEDDPDARQIFTQALSAFRIVLEPRHLNSGWQGYAPAVNGAQLGVLTMARSLLRVTAPEPNLPPTDAIALAEDLEAILATIAVADVPTNLRSILSRQIRFLITCLRNIEMCGAQAVYDALATGILTIGRVPIELDSKGVAKDSPRRSFLDRLAGGLRAVREALKAVDEVSKGVGQLQEAYHSVQNLLPDA